MVGCFGNKYCNINGSEWLTSLLDKKKVLRKKSFFLFGRDAAFKRAC